MTDTPATLSIYVQQHGPDHLTVMKKRTAKSAVVPIIILSLTAFASQAANIDWPTFGFNVQRTGENPFESSVTASTVAGLQMHWSFDLGAVTVMQPVLAAGVIVGGLPKDLIYMGSEHGDLYAIEASSGSLVWQRNLGSQLTGCPDMPDNIFGVSGSPFLDRGTSRMFVVGGDGNMYALDLATGATRPGWPVPVTTDPLHEHNYGGVNVFNGVAYAEIASYCDGTPYHGRVVAINIKNKTVRNFYPAGQRIDGGGIWGPGGVSIDPADGHVFTATGNALKNPENFRFSENVVELSPALQVLGFNYPGSDRRRRGLRSYPHCLSAAGLCSNGRREEQDRCSGHLRAWKCLSRSDPAPPNRRYSRRPV